MEQFEEIIPDNSSSVMPSNELIVKERSISIRLKLSGDFLEFCVKWVPEELYHDILKRGLALSVTAETLEDYWRMIFFYIKGSIRRQRNLGLYDNITLPDIESMTHRFYKEMILIVQTISKEFPNDGRFLLQYLSTQGNYIVTKVIFNYVC